VEPSIFNNDLLVHSFPIPLLAYELLEIELANTSEEDITEEKVQKMYRDILIKACGVVQPKRADLEEFLNRTDKVLKQLAKGAGKAATNTEVKKSLGFSSHFYKFIDKLDIPSLILNCTGFDYQKAKYLYCEVDRDAAMQIVSCYIDRIQQDHKIMLESAVYGFGGDMGEGSGTETEVDLSTGAGSKDMFSAINKKQ